MRLEEEAERCRADGSAIAVLVVSVGPIYLATWSGHNWHHQTVEVAKLLREHLRASDLCTEIAPLQFAICLLDCERSGAERAAARLLKKISPREGETGLAVYPEDGCEHSALIDLARGRLGRTAPVAQPIFAIKD